MSRQRAFTLIELLIVIAIIALLLTILAPTLTLAKKKVQEATCVANARSIATGQIAWAAGHDQRIVPYSDDAKPEGVFDNRGPDNCWADFLYREGYVETVEAFICPLDWRPVYPVKPDKHKISYGVNYYAYQINGPGNPGNPRYPTDWWPADGFPISLSNDVKRPSEKVLIVDADEFYHVYTGLWSAAAKGTWRHRHDWGAGYAFFDGHGEAITFQKMFGVPFVEEFIGWDEMGRHLEEHTGIASFYWNNITRECPEYYPAWAPWME